MLNDKKLKEFLNEKADFYENIDFIETDPIQIPHSFSKKEDIEISGFLSATIAWGKRKMIIDNSKKIMNYLDNSPYDFIINHTKNDLKHIEGSIHRTFNSDDFKFFIKSLKNIYKTITD